MSISYPPIGTNNNNDYGQLLLTGQKSLAIQNLKSAYAMVRTSAPRSVEPEKSKCIFVLDNEGRFPWVGEALSKDPTYTVWCTTSSKTAADVASTIHVDMVIADWQSLQAAGPDWIVGLKQEGDQNSLPAVLMLGDKPKDTSFAAPDGCLMDFVTEDNEERLVARVKFILTLATQVTQLRRKNSDLDAELAQKQRELFLHLELLMHAGGVKDKMLESINRLVPYLNTEGRSKLNLLIKQLRWELNDEANVNFVRAFDDLNALFYANLEQTCAMITRGEKRLCAFIVKGHSSSEIARITRKSQNSINVAFSRLRAKLGLTNTKDLRSFLERLFTKSGSNASLSTAQFLIS